MYTRTLYMPAGNVNVLNTHDYVCVLHMYIIHTLWLQKKSESTANSSWSRKTFDIIKQNTFIRRRVERENAFLTHI